MTAPTSSDDRSRPARPPEESTRCDAAAANSSPSAPCVAGAEEFTGRWTRRQWAHASLFATLGALVAAIVPGFDNAMQGPVRVQRTTMSLSLPQIAAVAAARAFRRQLADRHRRAAARRSSHVFEDLDIPASDLQRAARPARRQGVADAIKPGTRARRSTCRSTARCARFRYDRDDTQRVELTLAGDTVGKRSSSVRSRSRTVVISGEVGKSLFHSARKLGLTGGNINTLTDEIFKYDIDFNSDVDPERPLQRRGRADLARGRAAQDRPGAGRRPSPAAASCTPASATSATARPNTSPPTAGR